MISLDLIVACGITLAATLAIASGIGYYIIRRITNKQAQEPVETPKTKVIRLSSYWMEEADDC